jgi:nucleoside-diphosphate-sugar epimerase
VKCLVSGATGFIGRHLCQRLLDRGDTVIALSRSGATLPGGTITRALDLAHTMPGSDVLQGVDVVFHLAGIAHQHAPEAAYSTLNESATIKLARLCSAAGVARFVFLSSVKAMGDAASTGERSERECTTPTDAYGLSKWRAERALTAEFATDPMAVVILRPALVYGGSAKGNLALLAKGVDAGLPRPPELGARSMVAVEDLVNLLCIVAREPVQAVETWIVTDGQHYSTRLVYDLLRAAAGKSVGVAWMPMAGWRLAAALLDCRPGRAGDTTFDKLFGSELYSNRAVLESTSWRPGLRLEHAARGIMGAEGFPQ